jgi:glycosyltransferase involved in cell wall biosynthesis
VIPAYNAEAYIVACLSSLQAQTLKHWEALVVDDGSTDGTASIVESLLQQDPRIRLLRQPNAGVSAARNLAIRCASAERLAFLDADDLWSPEFLETLLALLDRENVDVAYCRVQHIDASGALLPDPGWWRAYGRLESREFFVHQYRDLFLTPSSVVLRASALQRHGGFDEKLRAAEDGELWLRLAEGGCTFFSCPQALCFYRKHPSSLSRDGPANFWAFMQAFPRYAQSPWLRDDERHYPFRIQFRNTFTHLKPAERDREGRRMFQAYRELDSDNFACQIMGLMCHWLPGSMFWWVCRFAVIPLAWHCEGWYRRRRRCGGHPEK